MDFLSWTIYERLDHGFLLKGGNRLSGTLDSKASGSAPEIRTNLQLMFS